MRHVRCARQDLPSHPPPAAIYVWAKLPPGFTGQHRILHPAAGGNRRQHHPGRCLRPGWRRLPAHLAGNRHRPGRRGNAAHGRLGKNARPDQTYNEGKLYMAKKIPEPTRHPRERAFLVGVELRSEPSLLSLKDSWKSWRCWQIPPGWKWSEKLPRSWIRPARKPISALAKWKRSKRWLKRRWPRW